MEPIIKYPGGKRREIKHFAKYMPDSFDTDSGTYYEPFLGGGAVFFEYMPKWGVTKKAFLSDANRQLMNFYKDFSKHYTRVRSELKGLEAEYRVNQMEYELEKKINPEEHVVNRNENRYYYMRDMFNGTIPLQYSYATVYYYINAIAYGCIMRYNKAGQFNTSFGHRRQLNIEHADLTHAQLLQQAELKCCKYKYAFERACGADSTGNFMFLDPPYDGTFARYGGTDSGGWFNEENHRDLAQDFKNLSCKALMIIGKTPLTEELYRGYIRDEYGVHYAIDVNKTIAKSKSGQNTHLIITNYTNY